MNPKSYSSLYSALNAAGRFRRSYDFILRKLNAQARRDRCKGDITCAWDWPTLRMVHPDIYAQLVALNDQYKHAQSYVQFYSPAVLEYAI